MLGSFHIFERTTGPGTQKNKKENQSGFFLNFNLKSYTQVGLQFIIKMRTRSFEIDEV